jgi:nitrite reductase/ring-hydroxylating ferredoxin subunit
MSEPIRIEGVTLPVEGHGVRVMAQGAAVALYRHEGRLYAIDAECSHVRGPLDQGRLTGAVVTCPWHGSQFSIETGAVEKGPAVRPVAAYTVTMDGSTVVLTRKA